MSNHTLVEKSFKQSIKDTQNYEKGAEDHTHSFERHDDRRNFYRCSGAKCYYLIERAMLIGKMNRCSCGREFILTREDLRRKRPRCIECSNTKKAKSHQKVIGVVDMFFKDDDPFKMATEDPFGVGDREKEGDKENG